MSRIRMTITGIMALVLAMLAPLTASAAPVKGDRPVVRSVKSICETGGRESAAYRRLCMTPGTIEDAASLWYSLPIGRKGRETRDLNDRRSVCKYAREFGGIRPASRELFFDVAYDNYRSHEFVLAWVGRFAKYECLAMEYRV